MADNLLEQLKELALRFQIDSRKTIGHAAKVETVIKVLSDVNQSYKKYLEIEFIKNENFAKAYNSNEDILPAFVKELDLLAVDLRFGSFEISVAPNITEMQSPLFADEVLQWKRESFDNYKVLISGDFRSARYIKTINERYNTEERRAIYKPLFNSIGPASDYTINIKSKTGKVLRTLVKPTKAKFNFYVPKAEKIAEETPIEKTVLAYVKVRNKGGDIDFKKSNIKEVFYVEELEHETYPYLPDFIQYDNTLFFLSHQLPCEVEFEDNNYIIRCEELDITVWGETRDEAEEAFSFSFFSLYENFYLENDKNLSPDAQSLKKELGRIIKEVIDETKKN